MSIRQTFSVSEYTSSLTGIAVISMLLMTGCSSIPTSKFLNIQPTNGMSKDVVAGICGAKRPTELGNQQVTKELPSGIEKAKNAIVCVYGISNNTEVVFSKRISYGPDLLKILNHAHPLDDVELTRSYCSAVLGPDIAVFNESGSHLLFRLIAGSCPWLTSESSGIKYKKPSRLIGWENRLIKQIFK